MPAVTRRRPSGSSKRAPTAKSSTRRLTPVPTDRIGSGRSGDQAAEPVAVESEGVVGEDLALKLRIEAVGADRVDRARVHGVEVGVVAGEADVVGPSELES